MTDYKPQVLFVSGRGYSDQMLKDVLGHEPTYGGLLSERLESATKVTFDNMSSIDKMLRTLAEDVIAIKNCRGDVKIALDFYQTASIINGMIQRNMSLDALLCYRLEDEKRNTLHDVMMADGGLMLQCLRANMRPVFVVGCPSNSEKNPYKGGIVFDEEAQRLVEERTRRGVEVVEQIKNKHYPGIIYLEERSLRTGIRLVNSILKDKEPYIMNSGMTIRSEADFLVPVEEDSTEQEDIARQEQLLGSLTDKVMQEMQAPQDTVEAPLLDESQYTVIEPAQYNHPPPAAPVAAAKADGAAQPTVSNTPPPPAKKPRDDQIMQGLLNMMRDWAQNKDE